MPTLQNQLYRIIYIHEQIATSGYPTVASLVDALEVDGRTIKRDIAFLRAQGAPIKMTRRGNQQGYNYTEPFTLFNTNTLDPHEVLALCLAHQVAGTTQQTPFHLALQRGIRRLLDIFGHSDRIGDLDHVSCFSSTAFVNEAETASYFRTLLDGINQSRQVRVRYLTMQRNAESERIIDPLWLYYADGIWYVLAYCHWRKRILHFALGRFRATTLLTEHFTPLDQATIDQCLRAALTTPNSNPVTARIWFDAEVAPRVRERYWGTDQRITPQMPQDGPCILTSQVSSLELLLRLLLPYGRHMRPLGPPELVAMLQQEVEGMQIALNKSIKSFATYAE